MKKIDDFGEYIKHLRQARNLTGYELAYRAGFSQSYISLIESQNKVPSPRIIKGLAKGLKVPYMELMEHAGYLDN